MRTLVFATLLFIFILFAIGALVDKEDRDE